MGQDHRLVARILGLITDAERDAGDDMHASIPTYSLRLLLQECGYEVPEYDPEEPSWIERS